MSPKPKAKKFIGNRKAGELMLARMIQRGEVVFVVPKPKKNFKVPTRGPFIPVGGRKAFKPYKK